jgi:hypothetical protein
VLLAVWVRIGTTGRIGPYRPAPPRPCRDSCTDYWDYLRSVDALLADFDARMHWASCMS